jgi:hypothetical protein
LEEEIVPMEEETVKECYGLVLGIERSVIEEDKWKCGDASYSVKDAYFVLLEDEVEHRKWSKKIWSLLILCKISNLVWRLFLNKLSTKENLTERRNTDKQCNLIYKLCLENPPKSSTM